MAQKKINITRDISAPENTNVSTGPNRFSKGSCGIQIAKINAKRKDNCGCLIKDIKWYPDEKKLVVEKPNGPDLVVDLTSIVQDEPVVKENILCFDPIKKIQEIVIKKGTGMTPAIQTAVNLLNDNFEKNWDSHFVWEDWSDEEESTNSLHANIGG